MAAKLELGLYLDRDASLSLQHQLRRRLVDAIERGVLLPGRRLPSTRSLARQAGVSRNTVTLAYDVLMAEGFLVSRARSGIFVAADVGADRVAKTRRRRARAAQGLAPAPRNWHQYPFPFLDGCIDPELLALEEWREAMRLASAKPELLRWGQGGEDFEDPLLVEELRAKVLPGVGLDAAAEEVLATASMRRAQWLAVDALAGRGTQVFIDPGVDADLRRRIAEQSLPCTVLERDAAGPVPPDSLPSGAVVVVGSRRIASGFELSIERAREWLRKAKASEAWIIECLPPTEFREAGRSVPSLRALDRSGCVVLIGGLAPAASLGTPPGFVSADTRAIERIRHARRDAGADFAPVMQRAWAHFLALGHYTAAVTRTGAILRSRRTELRDALNHYLHKFVKIGPYARSSAHWVRGPDNMNSSALAAAAASLGVLIEPHDEGGQRNTFTMGVTGIRKDRIREGVLKLARLICRDPALGSRYLRDEAVAPLRGRALHRAIAGRTLLYNTVYGEPCTLEVRRDGTLAGTAGHAREDCDTGRWRVEGDRWVRQWNSWSYGESLALHTIIEGDEVRWFNVDGLFVDTAVIVRSDARG